MPDAPSADRYVIELRIYRRIDKNPSSLRQSDFDGDLQPVVKDLCRRGVLYRDRFGFLTVARNRPSPVNGSSFAVSVVAKLWMETNKLRAASAAVLLALAVVFGVGSCCLCLFEGRDDWHAHATMDHLRGTVGDGGRHHASADH